MQCEDRALPQQQFKRPANDFANAMHPFGGPFMNQDFDRILIKQCSPTLARLKPASLFCIFTDRPDQLYRRVFEWNRLLGASGITVRILKFCKRNSSFLIYVYRPKLLWDVLSRTEILDFLFGMGYETVSNPDRLLKQLSCRLCLNQEFPHEIGAFLGYPLTDVIGFIEHKGRDFTFSGCWKSYGDPVEAQKRFSLYRKCTSVYQKMFENGTPIERLAVAA